MDDLGEAIAWPTQDPRWVGKVVLMSLVNLLPVFGSVVATGWMLACLDNLRRGVRLLAPAGLGYAGRGWRLFVVTAAYLAALGLGFGATLAAGAALVTPNRGNGAGLLAALVLYLAALGEGLVGVLLLAAIAPAVVIETERGGLGGGLNVARVAATARADPGACVSAAVALAAASLVGSVGALAAGAGIFLTAAYGLAVSAAAIRRYELDLSQRRYLHS